MQRISRLLILVAALGFDAAVTSAQIALPAADSATRTALLDSVGHARARWESARPQRYRMRVDFLCECARPLDNAPWVLVYGDSILRDSVRADQRPLVVTRPRYYTVNGLFAALEAALRDTLVTATGVRFDSILGTPLSFNASRRCVSRCTTGGWIDVHVLGFEPVGDVPRTTPFLNHW